MSNHWRERKTTARNERVLTKTLAAVGAERDQLRTEALEERASYEAELRRKEQAVAELVEGLKALEIEANDFSDLCQLCDRYGAQKPHAADCPFALIPKHAKPEAEADRE